MAKAKKTYVPIPMENEKMDEIEFNGMANQLAKMIIDNKDSQLPQRQRNILNAMNEAECDDTVTFFLDIVEEKLVEAIEFAIACATK